MASAHLPLCFSCPFLYFAERHWSVQIDSHNEVIGTFCTASSLVSSYRTAVGVLSPTQRLGSKARPLAIFHQSLLLTIDDFAGVVLCWAGKTNT